MKLKDEDFKKISRLVDEGYSYINIANMINYQTSAMQRIELLFLFLASLRIIKSMVFKAFFSK